MDCTPVTVTSRVSPFKRLGFRRLSRAHRLLANNPELKEAGLSACEAIARELSSQLSRPVSVEARLLPAALSSPLALAKPSAFIDLHLSALGAHALLELEAPLAQALVDALAGGKGAQLGPCPLTIAEAAGVGFLALAALRAIRGQKAIEQAFAPRFMEVAVDPSVADRLEPATHLAFDLRLTAGELKGSMRLLLPAAAMAIAAQGCTAPSGALAPELAHAELAFSVRAGATPIISRELLGLVPGDVLLLCGLSRAEGGWAGPGRWLGASAEIRGALSPEGFAIERFFEVRHPSPKEPLMDPNLDHVLPEASSIPVEIEVELAKLRLSIGELAALQPGALLELKMSPTDPVTLRVGERAVARAELVDIEGQIGARILALLS